MNDLPGIIRDSVDGKAKYCRIPIRRRRTPMYSYELEEILCKYMRDDGVDTDAIRQDALELFNKDQCEDAGILCSSLDFIELFERMVFLNEPAAADGQIASDNKMDDAEVIGDRWDTPELLEVKK